MSSGFLVLAPLSDNGSPSVLYTDCAGSNPVGGFCENIPEGQRCSCGAIGRRNTFRACKLQVQILSGAHVGIMQLNR